ncbi:MAG: 5-formyltetrahydrofolate cyclo-ligase [Alphaproteobacteria bacterium]
MDLILATPSVATPTLENLILATPSVATPSVATPGVEMLTVEDPILEIPRVDLEGVVAAKRALRSAAHERRGVAARAGEAQLAPSQLGENFFRYCGEVVSGCGVVGGYWPMRDEMDPRLLMSLLDGRGHILALPVIESRASPLVFRRWRPGDALCGGVFGTSEPLPSAECVRPGMLLTPLLAFDGEGYRLGYGGGYYDRTLAALSREGSVISVGLAWQAQLESSSLPRNAYDRALDWILTERGCAYGGAGGAGEVNGEVNRVD